ncbi:MAG: hypothetical protein OSB10_02495 [Planctomycetota bacterium]|nr:hypothetical protein [Planctomycetota bacterium]
MNRTTVLVLALVTLLAHILGLHQDSTGAFALPSDEAHVNFHIARNLLHNYGTAWSAGATPAGILEEGGTSLLWILIAALGEWYAYSPIRLTAVLGILCALFTTASLARLSRDRLVGVTAPALLVVSGPLAASAANGTETALFTLLIVLSFLALERRRSKYLGASLFLLVLTRSVGILWVLGFLAAALQQRKQCGEGERPNLAVAFLPALVAFSLFSFGRVHYGASFFAPDLQALFDTNSETVMLGLSSLLGLVKGTAAPLLILLPVIHLAIGKLSGTGKRSLGLTLIGAAYVILTGGSGAPMHAVWVPVLPLAYLAVQESLIGGLDRRPKWEGLAWFVLSITCLISVLASKVPGDIGPLRTQSTLKAMARNDARSAEAYGDEWGGRPAVNQAIRVSERLRATALFFRFGANIAPDSVILTPWPGAMGYLSQRRVVDLLGRTEATTDKGSVTPRTGRVRADTVAALLARPDYVVPIIMDRLHPPSRDQLIQIWLERYDEVGPTEARKAEFRLALEPYQLVAVPIPAHEEDRGAPSDTPAFLLRRRDLGLQPQLEVQLEPLSRFRVLLSHSGHHQIAELEVRVDTPEGVTWYLRPDGVFVKGTPIRTRTEALLFRTGDRKVEMVYAQLPSQLTVGGEPLPGLRMTVRLLNPFSDPKGSFSAVCEPLELGM